MTIDEKGSALYTCLKFLSLVLFDSKLYTPDFLLSFNIIA